MKRRGTDTTKARKEEEQLKDQIDFLRAIIESLPYPLYVINPENYIIRMANTASGWNGIANETTCHDLTHRSHEPCGGEEHICPADIVKETRKSAVTEHIHFDKDGHARTVEMNAHPIFDKDGNLANIIEFSLDITERKGLEAELREREEQYRLMIKNQGEGIGLTDPDECFVFANPAAEKIFGVAPGGLKGKNLKDFLSQEELTRVTEETKKRSQEEQSTYELEITTADNKVRFILVTATPQMNVEGEFTGTFGVFRDITNRKQMEVRLQQSEEKYRTLTENIGEGVIIVNEDETFVYANPSAERIYGVGKGELTGISVTDFLNDENLAIIKNQTQQRRQRESNIYEHEIVLKDGTKKDILGTATPHFEGEKFIGTLGVFRDITDRKKLTEALIESNATKDKFFSIIAHDLKSPFNSILGLTDALIYDFKNLDEKRIEGLLNTIKNSSERAFELLENLLVWANSQTGRVEYTPEMINLRQTINETISLLEGQATSKYIRISSTASENCTAFYDKQMIQTVLRNLVSNAIKFTPPNGDIVIAITSTDHFYEISVKDTGIGIAKEDIPELFRIESKYSTRGTADEKGTGLGLILCKEFVEKHGGKIWVESEEGNGSMFTFTIPTIK